MTEETVRFLIDQKIDFINTVIGICMLWWVSATVFCASILSKIWLSKDEIIKSKSLVFYLGVSLFTFFSSIVIFGCIVIFYITNTQNELTELVGLLGFSDVFYLSELSLFRRGMLCGTSSFFLAWLGWIILFLRLWKLAIATSTRTNRGR